MTATLNDERISTDHSERSLGRLVADATRDLSGLVRDELELAKSEIKADVRAAVKGGAMFGVAAFLGLLSVIAMMIAAGFGLASLGLAQGWAFLIVAGAFIVIALVLVLVGLRQVKKVKAPERTIATTKESVAVLKGGTSALK